MNTYTFKNDHQLHELCAHSTTPVLNELDNVDFWKVDTDHADKLLEVSLD